MPGAPGAIIASPILWACPGFEEGFARLEDFGWLIVDLAACESLDLSKRI
jgi:hypothetical protein